MSQKKEPLGRGIDRNYEWPEAAKNQNFKFGLQSSQSESAKDIIFP